MDSGLESLHEATRQLMEARSHQTVCEIAVATARDVLGLCLNTIWLHDATDDVLRPVAWTDEAAEQFDEMPVYEAGNSLSWRAFETGEALTYADLDEREALDGGRAYDPDSAVRSEVILPLGEYGVMNIGSTEPGAFTDEQVRLAGVLAANTESALRRASRERELRVQNERLEEFVSVVSHDLRNPLSIATGYLDVAREECDSDALDRVGNALTRMDELIDDLLALARQGEIVGEREPVDLGALAEEVWADVGGDRSLVVETDRTVQADRDRLRQVFDNLLSNAVEHGGEGVTVRVGDLPDGFYVADDGPGIPAEKRERVFESGYTTGESGTGFGLAIVKRIVEAHGWEIGVTDAEGGGARFEVTALEAPTPRSDD